MVETDNSAELRGRKVKGLSKIIILSDDASRLKDFETQLTSLGYEWLEHKKSSPELPDLKDRVLVLFQNGNNDELDKACIEKFRIAAPLMPIVVLTMDDDGISAPVARVTNAILRLPNTIDNIKRKLHRYIDPNSREKFRIYERSNIEVDVAWSSVDKKEIRRESRTLNVSRWGIFIQGSMAYPKRGEILNFVLKGPNGEIVTGNGIVRWLRTDKSSESITGFGLEFLSVATNGNQFFESLQISTN